MSEKAGEKKSARRNESARELARRMLRSGVSRCAAAWDALDSNRVQLRSARALADAAVATAATAHERLREALEILPQGIVFLDNEGRYILWNQKYADIYKRSADLFKVGARLEDTLRIGVERGDYPAANGARGSVDQGAARAPLQAGQAARAGSRRWPLHSHRGAADERRRHHRPAHGHHRPQAARGLVPAAVRRQSGADVRAAARHASFPRRQRGRALALRLQPRASSVRDAARSARRRRRGGAAPKRSVRDPTSAPPSTARATAASSRWSCSRASSTTRARRRC